MSGEDGRKSPPPLTWGRSRAEIRDEVAFYLEERAREFRAQGMSEEEALQAARAAFGDPDRIEAELLREAAQDRPGSARLGPSGGGRLLATVLDGLARDFRFGVRGLLRNPGFTFVAVITLALGIGANSAIFSMVRAVFLRATPVANPSSLVAVYTTCRRGDPRCSSSYPDFVDYRDRTRALTGLAAFTGMRVNLATVGSSPTLAAALLVSGDYFRLLGLSPVAGRLLGPDDDAFGAPRSVVVLSEEAWQARFGGDPGVVGSTIRVNELPFQVVGVAPPGFSGTRLGEEYELFLPLMSQPLLSGDFAEGGALDYGRFEERGSRWMGLVGRLSPDATLDGARAELLAVSEQLRREDPDARGPRSVTIDSAARYALPAGGRDALIRFAQLLVGVVALTLLLACANVANLLLARGTGRAREIGIRRALGSSRFRVVQQLVTESVLLALAGGVVGLAVATVMLELLRTSALPGGVELGRLTVGLDGAVLAFTFATALATGVLFGVAPALGATAACLLDVLKGAAAPTTRVGHRLRKTLVAVQVALCLTLVTGSVLFLRTMRNGLERDLGFEPAGLATVRFDVSLAGLSRDEASVAMADAIAASESLPQVRRAAVTSRLPLLPGGMRGTFAAIEGYESAPDEEIRVELVVVSGGALETLGTGLVEGRDLRTIEPEPVIVINRTMAERYFDGQSPLGRTVEIGNIRFTVVGVNEDVDWSSVAEENINDVILPLPMAPGVAASGPMTLVARTTGDPSRALPGLRDALQAAVPSATFVSAQAGEDVLGRALGPQRLGAWLLTAFGVLALVLASVGVAGVLGYIVDQHRRDIGIRMALGAGRPSVLGHLVGQMAWPVLLGASVGMAASLALGHLVEAFLLDVSPSDATTHLLALAVLAVAAVLAFVTPATRALGIEPMAALRQGD